MSAELILILRRPPGRPHLYRFRHWPITVGRDPDCALMVDDPAFAPVHLVFERDEHDRLWLSGEPGVRVSGVPLERAERRSVASADAVEVDDWLIEVAESDGMGPITDRRDRQRLYRALEAEHAVRAVGGPSLWVLRGDEAGAARPVPASGLSVGSGADDGLRLTDGGLSEAHYTVRAMPDGRVRLVARGPVRVRGQMVREATLGPGDLVFAGEAVCEVRVLDGEADPIHDGPPSSPPARAMPPAVLALTALALLALAAAWWLDGR